MNSQTTDLAAVASQWQAVRRSQSIPCCSLCAEPRVTILIEGEPHHHCRRCGDVEPVRSSTPLPEESN